MFRETIKGLFNMFCKINTGILLAVGVFVALAGDEVSVSVYMPWQILAVSAVCTLGALFYSTRLLRGKKLAVRILLHYLYINLVVLGAGVPFHWYNIRRPGSVAAMALGIAVVFAAVSAVSWTKDAWEASRMNEKLREHQGEKE